jgi:hypothetical protein
MAVTSRKPSSGTLRLVALEITDVSEERSASFISVTRTAELESLAVPSNRRTLRKITTMIEAIRSSETLNLIRATRLHIPGDGILHSRREGIIYYKELTSWAL